MDTEIFELASIIEDQMFLLHHVQQVVSSIDINQNVDALQQLFLSQKVLNESITRFTDHLFETTDKGDDDTIGIIMRGTCSCLALIRHVYESCSVPSDIQTTQDVDAFVCDILSSWTSSSITELIPRIKVLVGFLTAYGGLFILPDGIMPSSDQCFWCRYNKSLDTDENSDICMHYVVEKSHACTNDQDDIEMISCEATEKKTEDEALSLSERIGLREKRRKLRDLKRTILEIRQRFAKHSLEKEFATSMKQVSPFLYTLVGKMLVFMRKRIASVMHSSPMGGSITIAEALSHVHVTDPVSCKTRLVHSLTRVSLSKTNMKMIHEQFESLFLDPISLSLGETNMLRTSIIAKKVLLACQRTPESIVHDYERRCAFNLDKIVDIESSGEDIQDVLFRFVVVITAFNSWLTTQNVNRSFHIGIYRGDYNDDLQRGITLLYNYKQICFSMVGGTNVVGVYDDVVDICLIHLAWLKRKHLCPQAHSIHRILDS
jgi:hypothetical protein